MVKPVSVNRVFLNGYNEVTKKNVVKLLLKGKILHEARV